MSQAARAIVATDSDDKAVLMTLNIRRLAAGPVVAAVRESQHAPVLRQSGANAVITTAEAAGRLMGISLISPTAGAMMEDLLDPGEGLSSANAPFLRTRSGATSVYSQTWARSCSRSSAAATLFGSMSSAAASSRLATASW